MGKTLEERRPLVSSRTEPAPLPSGQVHLFERPGSARQPRRGPRTRPFRTGGVGWQKCRPRSLVSPRRAAPPGPAESLNCGPGRPPICPGWSRAPGRAKTWRRRSRGSATSGRALQAGAARHSGPGAAIRRPQPRGEVRRESSGWEVRGWGPRTKGKEVGAGSNAPT